jgi:hypothetical protein
MANEVRLIDLLKHANAEASRMGKRPLSYRRYMQLTVDGILPRPDKGRVDGIKALIHWIFYYRELSEGQGSLNLTDVRTRKEAARAEREELIVKKLKGELVPKNWAMEFLSLQFNIAKSHLWGLPKRMAGELAPIPDQKEIEQLLRREIRQILERLAAPIGGDKKKSHATTTASK